MDDVGMRRNIGSVLCCDRGQTPGCENRWDEVRVLQACEHPAPHRSTQSGCEPAQRPLHQHQHRPTTHPPVPIYSLDARAGVKGQLEGGAHVLRAHLREKSVCGESSGWRGKAQRGSAAGGCSDAPLNVHPTTARPPVKGSHHPGPHRGLGLLGWAPLALHPPNPNKASKAPRAHHWLELLGVHCALHLDEEARHRSHLLLALALSQGGGAGRGGGERGCG